MDNISTPAICYSFSYAEPTLQSQQSRMPWKVSSFWWTRVAGPAPLNVMWTYYIPFLCDCNAIQCNCNVRSTIQFCYATVASGTIPHVHTEPHTLEKEEEEEGHCILLSKEPIGTQSTSLPLLHSSSIIPTEYQSAKSKPQPLMTSSLCCSVSSAEHGLHLILPFHVSLHIQIFPRHPQKMPQKNGLLLSTVQPSLPLCPWSNRPNNLQQRSTCSYDRVSSARQ